MSFLTGQKDTDFQILGRLDDKSLASVCQANSYARQICSDERFWLARLVDKYGKDVLKGKPLGMRYRDYYTSGKANIYSLCLQFRNLRHLSLLVVDDFYNPRSGLINVSWTRDYDSLTYLLLKIALTRQTSYNPRDFVEEEKLKKLVLDSALDIPDYRRGDFIPEIDLMTPEEKKAFLKIINLPYVGRPQLLRSAGQNRPDMLRAFESPEIPFKLLVHIHKGFMEGKIPLDILWEELCLNEYVQQFSFKKN